MTLTTTQRAWCLAICPKELRAILLHRWRCRINTAKYRETHREASRASVRASRKKAIARGYYRKGGKGYRLQPGRHRKRREYMANYYATKVRGRRA